MYVIRAQFERGGFGVTSKSTATEALSHTIELNRQGLRFSVTDRYGNPVSNSELEILARNEAAN
jgi:hypothetical protein